MIERADYLQHGHISTDRGSVCLFVPVYGCFRDAVHVGAAIESECLPFDCLPAHGCCVYCSTLMSLIGFVHSSNDTPALPSTLLILLPYYTIHQNRADNMPPMTVRDQSIQSQRPPFSLSLSSRQEAAMMDEYRAVHGLRAANPTRRPPIRFL